MHASQQARKQARQPAGELAFDLPSRQFASKQAACKQASEQSSGERPSEPASKRRASIVHPHLGVLTAADVSEAKT